MRNHSVPSPVRFPCARNFSSSGMRAACTSSNTRSVISPFSSRAANAASRVSRSEPSRSSVWTEVTPKLLKVRIAARSSFITVPTPGFFIFIFIWSSAASRSIPLRLPPLFLSSTPPAITVFSSKPAVLSAGRFAAPT
ncbi:hypothetical protein SDC9_186020 [bioreactor metagenome]|uniref:Uncharacterized protein n=1 Tax=bioreactor metagenome TaxID=1076179 RepID=A0A645HIQ3_9ZZZZ